MGRESKIVDQCIDLMDTPEYIRNIGIVAHVDHGKTTLTDNLLAGAGMISEDLSGEQLAMDTAEDEQERGITIDAANVSMVHDYEGEDHLINLIDTPGHVDFGGDVTRAMRAVDGAVVVVDAVEGAMPQTETVLRQALREGVKPVLFINKVDRLINELQEGPQELQNRLTDVIDEVNDLIRQVSEEKFEAGWKVKVKDGSVAFGSALYNWAISAPSMAKSGIDFADVYNYNEEGKEGVQKLAKQSPLYEVVLNMVIDHFPNPLDAQEKRVPTIWRGDPESQIGEDMIKSNPDGEVVFMVTDIGMDPHAGEVATGRLFSGTLERGQELNVSGTAGTNRIQSVGIFMGDERNEVDSIPAGNIAAVTGLKDAIAGSTVSSTEMTPYESIEHISEPVVTVAVEAKKMDDLPKLIEVLQQISKEDPTVQVDIDEETGEHLISGMGELHLEVITQRIERNRGIPVTTSEPIVVYRETVRNESETVEGISPNRHNRFYISAEPLDEDVVKSIKLGDISMDMPEQQRREALQEVGFDKEDAQKVEYMNGPNILLDMTKGIQHLRETMELIEEGMDEALEEGPLAREPAQGVLLRLHDVKLHEDAIHRGPSQVIPATSTAIHQAMVDAEAHLLEPIQDVYIESPQQHMGEASSELQGRRGRIDNMEYEGELVEIHGQAPVSELFGFSSDIRSATEGKATWNAENAGFQSLPNNLQKEIIMEIRERKGLKQELPPGTDYLL
ncbi:MAG: elongation factor EF-2 [Halobacteria archaeon]